MWSQCLFAGTNFFEFLYSQFALLNLIATLFIVIPFTLIYFIARTFFKQKKDQKYQKTLDKIFVITLIIIEVLIIINILYTGIKGLVLGFDCWN